MAGPKKTKDNLAYKPASNHGTDKPPGYGQALSSKSASPPPIRSYDGPATPPPPAETEKEALEKRVKKLELSTAGYAMAYGNTMLPGMPPRPLKGNMLGQEVKVGLNTYPVTAFNKKVVYQLSVLVGKGNEKRGLIRKAFGCPTVQKALGNAGIIFDGNTLAWSLTKLKNDIAIEVDLDKEFGRPARSKPNKVRVVIDGGKEVRFDKLEAYMAGKCTFDNNILEAITFLDHLLRETPTQRFGAIKRSFFSRKDQKMFNLSPGVEAYKGVYASMRIANWGGGQPGRLTVNVDVANGAFFMPLELHRAAATFSGAGNAQAFSTAFERSRRPPGSNMYAKPDPEAWEASVMYRSIKRLHRVKVLVKLPKQEPRIFIVKEFLAYEVKDFFFEMDVKGADGEVKLGSDGKKIKKQVSLQQYFSDKYHFSPLPGIPVVKTTKGEVFPSDVCHIPDNERYPYKLDDKETSQMIKFAVTLPKDRLADINHGLKMLDWPNDPKLKEYGVQIAPQALTATGRLLPPPDVVFAGKAEPGVSAAKNGRWRLDGKKFASVNPTALVSWGVCVVRPNNPSQSVNPTQVENFFREFVKIYQGHGGRVQNMKPVYSVGSAHDGGECVSTLFEKCGVTCKSKPQILFFILPFRDTDLYLRIKKSCDCRFGVVSQCLQASHVAKNQGQYISNVCMKVNAKLGGFTCLARGNTLGKKVAPGHYDRKDLIIGADVSHAAPGVMAGSLAAITMSLNKEFTRYAAACQTNGYRLEMITKDNFDYCLGEAMKYWIRMNGGKLPERIYYFRDGVSEGQYSQVLAEEVRSLKTLCHELDPKTQFKLIVVIATKRHHIRFFPEGAAKDQNGNPLPGTLVETMCTSPFEFDFYLNAHRAIKGTSRPIHYTVLLNEANMDPQALQQMIFEHSFQYIRATTPVSLFPAVYYAHLASNRCKAHENKPAEAGGKKDAAQLKKNPSSGKQVDLKPLIAMNNGSMIRAAMWYV